MSYSCHVDRHGTHHIEMELSYPLPSGDQESKYGVEVFAYEHGERKLVKTARVYHVNMIIRLTENISGQAMALFKYRILLTRNGIQRVELVS